MNRLYPVILCGGSGVRLWPLSRTNYPKQFMDLGGHTLFADTVLRAQRLEAVGEEFSPLVICNEEQRFLAAAALQSLGVSGQIILEPDRRNTAPAIALAAFAACMNEEDPLLLVLPSDHQIVQQDMFADAIQQALKCALEGYLVTFGVVPDRPETGYGYIKQGRPLAHGFEVSRFVEKPSVDVAEKMLEEGGFLWNSGIFLFRASVYLNELNRVSPEIYTQCKLSWQNRSKDLDFIRPERDAFLASPSNSIDYALMENTTLAAVVPLSASWSDLGSWDSFYTISEKDCSGNVEFGDVITEDVKACYLHSTGRLLTALGVSDLVVLETPDAVLVADRHRSQDVKKLVENLENARRPEKDEHTKVWRPWGSYEIIAQGAGFKVKHIIVNSGALLSLQMHYKRAEHWVVVNGVARVTVGDRVFLLHKDQSTYIPLGKAHRLENPSSEPLEIVEVQTGAYLGEDDIVRLEDTYGRVEDT